jgi:hypothetical protein
VGADLLSDSFATSTTARDANGAEVGPLSPKAMSLCAAGAVVRAHRELGERPEALRGWAVLTHYVGMSPQELNNIRAVTGPIRDCADALERGDYDAPSTPPTPLRPAGRRRRRAEAQTRAELRADAGQLDLLRPERVGGLRAFGRGGVRIPPTSSQGRAAPDSTLVVSVGSSQTYLGGTLAPP